MTTEFPKSTVAQLYNNVKRDDTKISEDLFPLWTCVFKMCILIYKIQHDTVGSDCLSVIVQWSVNLRRSVGLIKCGFYFEVLSEKSGESSN